MKLDRYDDGDVVVPRITSAIHKARLLLETLQAVATGNKLARHTLVDMAREELYEGPVVKFRLDDLFDNA
jgi:hypothetical protein